MSIAILDNVVGAEFNPGTGVADTYEAPREQTVGDQQTQINALNASVLALANKIRTVTTTPIAALTTDKTILTDATAASITINLPAASSAVAQIITVKKIDASANTVTIDPNGAEVIDGATTKIISAQWSSLTFQCNGTAWFVI
jgi:hypothetical protein